MQEHIFKPVTGKYSGVMNLNILSTNDKQNDMIIQFITNTVQQLLRHQNQVTLALSGGKSPVSLFKRLSTIALPWEKIIITLVDERVTQVTSADSNQNLVCTFLLQNQAVNAQFKGLVLPDHNMQQMLMRANEWVNQIDLAILGMGEDGHIASIFPGCPEFMHAIDQKVPPAYIETNPSSAKYTRISLNLRALVQIKYLILSINSNLKLKILQEASRNDNKNYPISYLLKRRSDVHIFLS